MVCFCPPPSPPNPHPDGPRQHISAVCWPPFTKYTQWIIVHTITGSFSHNNTAGRLQGLGKLSRTEYPQLIIVLVGRNVGVSWITWWACE